MSDKEKLKQVQDDFGNYYQLTGELKRGGQGVVYRTSNPNILVKVDLTGDEKLKNRYMELRLLPLDKDLRITLPVVPLAGSQIGYVMQLLEDMEGFGDAFSGHTDEEIQSIMTPWLKDTYESNSDIGHFFGVLMMNGGCRRLYRAYFEAARILSALHASGLVYCDFSPNNAFVSTDLAHTNVWLIDADNVNFQEEASKCYLMTPDYGAPEVQAAVKGASFSSDVFAFASSLFQQGLRQHPFEGDDYESALEDEDVEDVDKRRNVGEFPYVLDEDEDSNFDESIAQRIDLVFPENLMELFQQTFGPGRLNRTKRPLMAEWASGLAYALDATIHCSECGMDYNWTGENKCRYCDHENQVIHIISTTENGNKLWEFAHEINKNEEILIPMRIVRGFFAKDESEYVFIVKLDNTQQLQIESITNKITCYIEELGEVRRFQVLSGQAIQVVNKKPYIKTNISFEIKG